MCLCYPACLLGAPHDGLLTLASHAPSSLPINPHVSRHLYPADHDLVIEEQYLERCQAAALAQTVQDEETGGRKTKEAQPKAKTIFHIFDKAVRPGEIDVDRLKSSCARPGPYPSAHAPLRLRPALFAPIEVLRAREPRRPKHASTIDSQPRPPTPG